MYQRIEAKLYYSLRLFLNEYKVSGMYNKTEIELSRHSMPFLGRTFWRYD